MAGLRARWSFGWSAALAIVGLLLYLVRGQLTHAEIDLWGLVLAAIVPIAAIYGAAWIAHRLRAPAALYNELKRFYDEAHPSFPYGTLARVDPAHGVTLELLPVDPTRVIAVREVTCEVVLRNVRSNLRTPILDRDLSRTHPILVNYPGDFDHTEWPLPPGMHEATWHISSDEFSAVTGAQFRIPGRTLWPAVWWRSLS
jgi:hypothetical protein